MNIIQSIIKYGLAAVALFLASTTYAGEIVISNMVQSSASSGGNTASGGVVVEGESSVYIFSETIVNGKTVEHIEEMATGTSRAGPVIEIETRYATTTHGGSIKVQTKAVGYVNSTSSNINIINSKEILSGEGDKTPIIDPKQEIRSTFISFVKKYFNYVFSIFRV